MAGSTPSFSIRPSTRDGSTAGLGAELAAGRHRATRDARRDAVAILTELDHPDADEVRAKLADHGARSQAG